MPRKLFVVAILSFYFGIQPYYCSGDTYCIPSTELVQTLSNSSTSEIINITFANPDPTLNLISCEELHINSNWTGGKLILSDSPEYPKGTGKLYEHHNLPPTTFMPFTNRIFMYHVNGKAEGNLRFSVLIQNTDKSTHAALKLIKSGVAGPSTNYLYTGKVAADRWMRSTLDFSTDQPDTITIPSGSTVQLDEMYNSHSVPPGFLLHGIWDYSINTTHSVFLCSLQDNEHPIDDCISSQLLPRDSAHIRGTFNNSMKILDYSIPGYSTVQLGRILQFPIADGLVDEFISGEDATDGSAQLNSGNYGVLYRFPVRVPASYLVNPRGGIWSGAMEVSGQVYLMPEKASSIRYNTQGVLIGSFRNSNSSEEILYMPVGGSNLPIRIALIS